MWDIDLLNEKMIALTWIDMRQYRFRLQDFWKKAIRLPHSSLTCTFTVLKSMPFGSFHTPCYYYEAS